MATKKPALPVISMPKGKDELRFEVYQAKSGPLGSLRVFYEQNGEWKPGKQGMTLKKAEFKEFVAKLKVLYDRMPDDAEEE